MPFCVYLISNIRQGNYSIFGLRIPLQHNTGVWLYTQGCGTLFAYLYLTLSQFISVFVPSIHSQCPIPPLFQREQGQRSPACGARFSFVSCY
jgi:hypothetical protein